MKRSVTITAAWIGFSGLILAAIISGIFYFIGSSKQTPIIGNDDKRRIEHIDSSQSQLNFLNEPQMLEVPSGYFIMGSDDIDYALPQKRAELSTFFISKFETTNEQYEQFLKADSNREPPIFWAEQKFKNPKQPVVGISWYDAIDYCKWLSHKTNKDYRLPTEVQWEKAARGTQGNKYPWGNNEPDINMTNFSQPHSKPAVVGSYSIDINSEYNTMDMAGNVAEWCIDQDNKPMVKGGSWKDNAAFLHCASRRNFSPDVEREILGFRIVRIP